MNIFCVTTIENIDTIDISIKKHEKYTKFDTYTIIVPLRDLITFENKFNDNKKIIIKCEDEIISKNNYDKIVESFEIKYGKKLNKKRSNWYYQQVLKLSYAIEENGKILMWDADSVPLQKINFFNTSGDAIVYSSIIERHTDYFQTISQIFDFRYPEKGYTIQFFPLNEDGKKRIRLKLGNFQEKNDDETNAIWITKVIIKALIFSGLNLQKLKQSYFSEQEMVGIINEEITNARPIPIKHFRPGRGWQVTNRRLKILKILNYKYYTCENNNNLNQTKVIEALQFILFLIYDTFRSLRK